MNALKHTYLFNKPLKRLTTSAALLVVAVSFSSCSNSISESKVSSLNLNKSYTITGKSANVGGSILSKIAQSTKTVTIPAGLYTLTPDNPIASSATFHSAKPIQVKDSNGKINTYEGGLLAGANLDAPHSVYYKRTQSGTVTIANLALLGQSGIGKRYYTVTDATGQFSDISTNKE